MFSTAQGVYKYCRSFFTKANKQTKMLPPIAPKRPFTLGDGRTDPYYWFRDDARENKDVLTHLESENTYTKHVMEDTLYLQDKLYNEMRGRIQETDESVPVLKKGYLYYHRTLEGKQYKIHCRRKWSDTEKHPEEVILDENERKEQCKYDFYQVEHLCVSPDQRLLAWSEDTVGDEKYVIHVKDLTTGLEVDGSIPNTNGSIVWANDNMTVFYVVKDTLDRPFMACRHKVGKDYSFDVVVFDELDESFHVGISKTRSGNLILIHTCSAITSEIWYKSADEPDGLLNVITLRKRDVEYTVAHRGDCIYMLYRDPECPNSELRVALLEDPTEYRTLIPHRNNVKIEDYDLSEHHLAVFERVDGQQRATIFTLGKEIGPLGFGYVVEFDEPAHSLWSESQGDFDSTVLRMGYSSLKTPVSVIEHDMVSNKTEFRKVQPVLGGYDRDDYVTERLWATSHDGVAVPISVVYKKGTYADDPEGGVPCLLDGYGSYEYCNDPYFDANVLCLLDRGWIYALAHVRGGGEMGRLWYEDGKFLKKKNTFLDFVACAEHLIKGNNTSPKNLHIYGASAGGLLIGAVLNMRPDLFNAAVMRVPFVDVITTMSDETIPLTIIEKEEWGSPKDPEFYDYMLSYSPMDNIKETSYPHVLATGGLHDTRVGYWEPAKFIAKLRDLKKGDELALLKMDLGAGHFSVTGRFDRLKETALEWAFLIKCREMGRNV